MPAATRARPRVAFVVQRCGAEVNGGAESLCLQMAQRMSTHWQTEVLTTCALDYVRWENYYPATPEIVDGVTIRRFPVNLSRDVAKFNRLSDELLAGGHRASLQEQEAWMQAQGPNSSGLLGYLAEKHDAYEAFVFFGYLYATTYFGLPIVCEKAWLAPLGHDEWPIYLTMWDAFFALPAGFIFQTPEERDFLQGRFPSLSLEGPTAGIGVQTPAKIEPERFRARYRIEDKFILYVGRIDSSKGCDELFSFFIRYRAEVQTRLRLVLIGREVLPIPFHDDIIHLGFVTEEEKWDAMTACDWLVAPSRYESLSIVMLEAWLAGRPSLVNAKSEVMLGHCRRSHGGLWYQTYEDWAAALEIVDEATKQKLGKQGRDYVTNTCSWDRVIADYRDAINTSSVTRS